ncbi:MAG: Na+/H+ antiporter subunit E [Candidatus Dormibacteraeota bacterium]|nr:Na+/H+ antiporter subunit E [Candidatus Dormibacteraeota bacterium]
MRKRGLATGVVAAVMLGLWLLLLSTTAIPEVLAGLVAAAIATTAGLAAVRTTGSRFRPRAAWLWELRRLPWLVLSDSALAARVLVRAIGRRRSQSRFIAVGPLPIAGSEPRTAARRALYTVACTLPPGTIVVGLDEESRSVLLHQLVARPPDLGLELR